MAVKNGDVATLIYVPGAFEAAFGSRVVDLVNCRVVVGNKRQRYSYDNDEFGQRWYIRVLDGEHSGVELWVYECMLRTCIFT